MSQWIKYDLLPLAERKPLPRVAGVYVIYVGKAAVYVGQSVNVANRLAAHNIRFGYGRHIHTPWGDVPDNYPITAKVKLSRRMGDWAMWEIRLIARLKPQFNTHHLKRKVA